ncbi:MAG: MgtC/SapB family protein [Candidatus Baltobacteraceae bacterium]
MLFAIGAGPYSHALSTLVDLLAAAILGGLIGVQRQAAHKPAGLRTHVLVSVGACAFMEVSRLVGDSRIAAGVITGIGFLGAGAIVRTGTIPRGLTTAASIWVVSAVGLSLGLGTVNSLEVAGITALFAFCVLAVSDGWIVQRFPRSAQALATIAFEPATVAPDAVRDLLAREGRHVHFAVPMKIEPGERGPLMTLAFTIHGHHIHRWATTIEELERTPGIRSVEISGDLTSG